MKKKNFAFLLIFSAVICVACIVILRLAINKVVANDPATAIGQAEITEIIEEPSSEEPTETNSETTEPIETTTEEPTEEPTEEIAGLNNNDVLNDVDIKNIESFTFGSHKMVLPCKLSELIGEEKMKTYESNFKELFSKDKDSVYYDFTVMTDEELHKAVCVLYLANPYDEKNLLDNIYIRQIQTNEPTMSVCGITVGSTAEEVVAAFKENQSFVPVGLEEGSVYVYRSVHYRLTCLMDDGVVAQMLITYIGDDPSTILLD